VDYHILPVEDLEAHLEDDTCPCRPTFESVLGGRLVIHNAFDGRELVENSEVALN
jgi:hypothetical protein